MTTRAPAPRRRSRLRRAAFTLIEVTVAMTIGLAAVYAGTICVVQLKRILISAEKAAEADANAKLAIDGLVSSLQGVGGYALRPWNSIYLEESGHTAPENPSWHCGAILGVTGGGGGCPNGSDRLSVVQHFAEPPPVTFTEMGVTSGGGVLQGPSTCGTSGTVCCWSQDSTGTPANYLDPGHLTAMLVTDDGSKVIPVRFTSLDASSCEMTWQALSALPPFTWKRRFHQGANMANADTGTAVLARFVMFFLSDTGDHLIKWWDQNGDGAIQDGEATYFSTNTSDVQFAVGFDLNGDGQLTDNRNTTDEWYGNAVNDSLPSAIAPAQRYPFAMDGTGEAPSPADRPEMSSLRMVQAAAVVFSKSTYSDEGDVRILNGITTNPDRGRVLRLSAGRAAFRNLNIYRN